MSTMTDTIRALGPIKLGIMAAAAVVLIAFFVFLTLRMSSPVMTPLYSNLPMKDSSAIVSELEKRGIPYELRGEGAQVLVPSDQMLRLRMNMAEKGLPSGGSIVGYEIFDQTDAMGTSNFVLNLNMIRALEGELSRTISSFDNIESARVHLVMPKRELFTRDKEVPTASVALTLRGAGQPAKSTIAAIQHLVATAVPGLQSNKITIVDSRGRLLAKGMGEGEEDSSYASDAQEYRVAYERRMTNTIESLLASTLGADKVKAEVTADIGFDRIVTKSETYDPEGQVARSVQESEEQENSNEKDAADTVSVANNLPDANKGSAGGAESNHTTKRSDATTNYEISKEVRNQVSETGKVNRLSVAVLVDGVYTPDKDGKQVYAPRSPEDLKQIATLVKSAIGFDQKRGDTVEVVNMQFSNVPEALEDTGPLGWLKDDLHNIVQTLVIGGVAILTILLVIRPLVTRAIEATRVVPELDAAEQAALNAPSITAQLTDQRFDEDDDDMINIDRINGRVKSGTFRKISEAIDKHPEEALGVLRRWMMAS